MTVFTVNGREKVSRSGCLNEPKVKEMRFSVRGRSKTLVLDSALGNVEDYAGHS